MNTTDKGLASDDLLREALERLLAERCTPDSVRAAEDNGWAPDLWLHLSQAGFPWVGAEAAGGLMHVAQILHLCGKYAAPLPIAETGMLGGWLLELSGRSAEQLVLTVPVPHPGDEVALEEHPDGWGLQAAFHWVPWVRMADEVVLVATARDGSEQAVAVPASLGSISDSKNIAGEPRGIWRADTRLDRDHVRPVPHGSGLRLRKRGALSRALLIGGTLERSVELAAAYARERHQFGKAIGTFQAVQQHLAVAAEQAAATSLAAWVAAFALQGDDDDSQEKVAIARAVAGDAVSAVTFRVHQVFGAIGMSRECQLQLLTRRAWSWVQEWHTGADGIRELGLGIADRGAGELWAYLSSGLQSA
jgi:acyl-CoA dehydrogenase